MEVTNALYIVLYILAVWGFWLIISTVINGREKLSYDATIRNYNKLKEKKSSTSAIDATLENFSKRFAKFIYINSVRRSEMEKSLYIIGSSQTPEEYMAYTYTVSLSFLLIGLVLFLFNKLFGISIIVCSVIVFIYLFRKLSTESRQTVKQIDRELPKFVAYLKQALLANKNVLYVLESYKTSNMTFARELSQTLADAKTSNFNSACVRLDQRINSNKLKMVLNGLRSAYNGEDVGVYFQILENDFSAFEVNELKKDIKTVPQKLMWPKILIYMAAAFAMLLPLILTIINSFQEIFSSGAITR